MSRGQGRRTSDILHLCRPRSPQKAPRCSIPRPCSLRSPRGYQNVPKNGEGTIYVRGGRQHDRMIDGVIGTAAPTATAATHELTGSRRSTPQARRECVRRRRWRKRMEREHLRFHRRLWASQEGTVEFRMIGFPPSPMGDHRSNDKYSRRLRSLDRRFVTESHLMEAFVGVDRGITE